MSSHADFPSLPPSILRRSSPRPFGTKAIAGRSLAPAVPATTNKHQHHRHLLRHHPRTRTTPARPSPLALLPYPNGALGPSQKDKLISAAIILRLSRLPSLRRATERLPVHTFLFPDAPHARRRDRLRKDPRCCASTILVPFRFWLLALPSVLRPPPLN